MKLTFSLAMGFWSTLLLKESAADKKSLASEDVVFIREIIEILLLFYGYKFDFRCSISPPPEFSR